MSPNVHRLYIAIMSGIVLLVFCLLAVKGISYYSTPFEERFYHPDHDYFKPSGLFGHGLGIMGTFLMAFGVGIYIARKRYNFLAKFGRLKYWLEFHIFLCTLGPVMILFHTAFKFGGVVSIAFWSMVAVVLSGVIGRFIYIQIPRTIEGREMSLGEVQQLKKDICDVLKTEYQMEEQVCQEVLQLATTAGPVSQQNLLSGMVYKFFADQKMLRTLKRTLRNHQLAGSDIAKVSRLVKNELSLNNKIERLLSMQKLFKYWHVAHLPFAIIMLLIVLLHVGITLAFGYKWVF